MKVILVLLGLSAFLYSGGTFANESVLDAPEATAHGLYQISVNWSELKRGQNILLLSVTDTANNPVSGASVTVAYEMADMTMNPPDRPVVEKGNGVYEKSIFLGMRGNWKFNIKVNSNSAEDTLDKLEMIKK